MRMRSVLVKSFLVSGAVMAALAARADGSGSPADLVNGIKPIVETRLRYESVDQDGIANEAEAVTLRARLGFETGKAWNTSLLVDGDFIWALNDHYNSTTNGNTAYPVVADPEGYEFNRLQFTNTSLPMTTITVGRQRIVLDDERFVGNSAWRQNEQTFDSVRVVNRSVRNFTFDIAYVSQVNRVFGTDSPQGRYEGDSVLANVSWQLPVGKLTGFGYRLDFDPISDVPAAARDSSMTYGARFTGERPVKAMTVAWAASYATEHDEGANPLSFDLDYYLAELTGRYKQFSLSAGIESLEGDGVKGFTTPVGTLHKFQGWADKYLTTPADGIVDRYINVGYKLKAPAPLDALSAIAVQHWYEAERISLDYGSELDVLLQAKWHHFSGAIKYADYRADHFATDTAKLWAQVEYAW
jgi:hypothetical protein